MKKIPNVTRQLRCAECGHEQEVTSIVAEQDDNGDKSYWFGSDRDFCEVCDKLSMEEV